MARAVQAAGWHRHLLPERLNGLRTARVTGLQSYLAPLLAERPQRWRSADRWGWMAAVSRAQAEVLVIGAGPSGLFAAAELARNGVPTRVGERQPEPHRQARATALPPGTLEILARAQILDAARPPIAGAAARARSGGSGYDRDGRVLSVSAD